MKNLMGVHKATGEPLDGLDHLRQSIWDILTTRRGERIMRPEYGSNFQEFVDRPVNPMFLLDLYYECVVAIHRWEPRARVVRISADAYWPNIVTLELTVRVDGITTVVLGGVQVIL